jgi:hypothetical protein
MTSLRGQWLAVRVGLSAAVTVAGAVVAALEDETRGEAEDETRGGTEDGADDDPWDAIGRALVDTACDALLRVGRRAGVRRRG